MSSDDEPLQSFQGKANAVRKDVIRWLMHEYAKLYLPDPDNASDTFCITREHASYIGYELLRAEMTENYVQD